MQRTGGQILVDSLIEQQVDTLFMIPGVQLDWAVDALRQRQDKIKLFVPRHEQATTYMADGYYRASGKPGVAMVVPGPGVLNAGAGLATAYAANSKVVFVAGNIHSHGIGAGYGLLHEIKDQTGLIAGLTKWNTCIGATEEIASAVRAAFTQVNTGRPRPVGLEVSHDTLEGRVDDAVAAVPAAATVRGAQADLDRAVLRRIAGALDGARLPALYVGGGVLQAHAGDALKRLAEKLNIPVIMSENGLGALSDRHPLAMNTLAGRAVFEHADVVVVIGSRFMNALQPTPSWSAAGTRFLFINIDAADMAAPRNAALALQADARVALEELAEIVKPREVLSRTEAEGLKAWAQAQIDRVSPQADYIRALRAALPDDGILVNELTQVGYLARIAFPVYGPRTYIGPTYQGTLGYGFPTALGAAAGGDGRRVVSITGDGGFGWNLQELATARKYNLPVTLVIFNDGHFGNVRMIQKRVFGPENEVAVALENPDFLALAAAFRIPAVRVGTPAALQAAITESLSEDGPVLIEVPVGEMPGPWHLLRLQPMPGVPVPDAGPHPLSSRPKA
ncbi:thiamine pyrophosphate-dependent enzyme [Burkholderia sp. L27(2015)]|uniref:thiamine pyrophosphate-dependent enzyme n=1 Tax=Burkholderia sp. L27(2015) TaxID=1641858 RepID=UPI00131C6432|nr:thiamine pyrophosphate-dependent enzyme [Burkholderia sp. L27(2015)]